MINLISSSSTESPESLNEYAVVLMDSDLTFCPAGKNSESSRIYEALSLGSVPVVEDPSTMCGNQFDGTALQLLKKFNAPIVYIKSWENELDKLLSNEQSMTIQEKIARRATVVNWYNDFRKKCANQFLHILNK